MAYLPNHRRLPRNLSGLGGVESCGSTQVWDPNITFMGVKGQCMPRANYSAAQLVDPNAYPGTVKSNEPSGPSAASQIVGALIGGLVTPKPAQQVAYQAPASSGISTGTVLIGLGALAAVVIIATR
jgi:hypothetical protein